MCPRLAYLLSTAIFVMVQFPSASWAQIKANQRWGLVIGAQDYKHFPALKYARSDATNFRELLTKKLGFPENNTRLLVDGGSADTSPTAGNILGELDDLLSSPDVESSDTFVLFFAGHGTSVKDDDYILPVDAREGTVTRVGVSVKEIIERIGRSKLKNVWLVFDACRNGSTTRFGEWTERRAKEQNLALFLACEPGSVSYESSSKGAGLFTDTLISTISNLLVEKKIVWISDVSNQVRKSLPEATASEFGGFKQTPETYLASDKDILLEADPSAVSSRDFITLAKSKGLSDVSMTSALLQYAGTADEGSSPFTYEAAKLAFHMDPKNNDARFLFAMSALTVMNLPLAIDLVYAKNSDDGNSGLALLRLLLCPEKFSDIREIRKICLSIRPVKRTDAPWLDDSTMLMALFYSITFGATKLESTSFVSTFAKGAAICKSTLKLSELIIENTYQGSSDFTPESVIASARQLISNLAEEDIVTARMMASLALTAIDTNDEVDELVASWPIELLSRRAAKLQKVTILLQNRYPSIEAIDNFGLTEIEFSELKKFIPQDFNSADALKLIIQSGIAGLQLIVEIKDIKSVGSSYVDELVGTLISLGIAMKERSLQPTAGGGGSHKESPLLQRPDPIEFAFTSLLICEIWQDYFSKRRHTILMDTIRKGASKVSMLINFGVKNKPDIDQCISLIAGVVPEIGVTPRFWELLDTLCDLSGNFDLAFEIRKRQIQTFEQEWKVMQAHTDGKEKQCLSLLFYENEVAAKKYVERVFDKDEIAKLFVSRTRTPQQQYELVCELVSKIRKTGEKQWLTSRDYRATFPVLGLLEFKVLETVMLAVAKGDIRSLKIMLASEMWSNPIVSDSLIMCIARMLASCKAKDRRAFIAASIGLAVLCQYEHCSWLEAWPLELYSKYWIGEDSSRQEALFMWRLLGQKLRSDVVKDISFGGKRKADYSCSVAGKALFTSWFSSDSFIGEVSSSVSVDGKLDGSFVRNGLDMRFSGTVSNCGVIEGTFIANGGGQKSTGTIVARVPAINSKLPKNFHDLPIHIYLFPKEGGVGLLILRPEIGHDLEH